jgi:hypothetical protein
MSIRTTYRPAHGHPAADSPARVPQLSSAQLAALRRQLQSLRADCEQQMTAASATLAQLREDGSLTDPAAQAPLMAALRSLGDAERTAVDVADALTRMTPGGSAAACAADVRSRWSASRCARSDGTA